MVHVVVRARRLVVARDRRPVLLPRVATDRDRVAHGVEQLAVTDLVVADVENVDTARVGMDLADAVNPAV